MNRGCSLHIEAPKPDLVILPPGRARKNDYKSPFQPPSEALTFIQSGARGKRGDEVNGKPFRRSTKALRIVGVIFPMLATLSAFVPASSADT